MSDSKKYYPLMLDLADKRCLVVGGGKVAERKIYSLLEADASVTVVSPDYTPKIRQWVQTATVHGEARKYTYSDGEGAFLVIAAANDEEVNESVRTHAMERSQLVNVADNGERGNFILPAVLRKGKLLISVATSGASPMAARTIRDDIAQIYGAEYEAYLDFHNELRIKVKQSVANPEAREHIFRKAMQLDILWLIRSGEFGRYQTALLDMLVQDGSERALDGLLEHFEHLMRADS